MDFQSYLSLIIARQSLPTTTMHQTDTMDSIKKFQAESAKYALYAVQAELNHVKNAVHEAEEAATIARIEAENLQPLHDAGIKFIDDLRFDLLPLSTHVEELEARIKAEKLVADTANSAALHRHVGKLELELNDLKKQVIEKNILIYEKAEELENIQANTVKSKAAAAQENVEALSIRMKLLDEEYKKLEVDFEDKWPGMDTQVKEFEGEEKLVAELKELSRQLEIARSAVHEKSGAQAKAQARLSAELNRINEQLNLKTETADGDKKELSAQIAGLESSLEKLKKELRAVKAQFEKKKEEICMSRKLNDELISKLKNQNSKMEELSAALDDYRAQNIKLSEAKPNGPVGVADGSHVADLEARLNFEQSCNDQERAKNSRLMSENARLQAMLDNVEQKLNASHASPDVEITVQTITGYHDLKKDHLGKDELTKNALTQVEPDFERMVQTTAMKDSTHALPHTETSVATATEVHELKEKIEQLMPLYEVGKLVRTRKMEICLPRPLQDTSAIKNGWEIAFSGAAVADSTLFMDFANKPYSGKFDFASRYGVTASFVWENRKFEMLMEVLSMKFNMRTDYPRFLTQRDGFIADCNKFLVALTPNTAVNTDEKVIADADLKARYKGIKEQYGKACGQYEKSKARQSSTAK